MYYRCSLRNKCKGTGRIDINVKKFCITNLCNTNIKHDIMDYQDFAKLMKNNGLKDINFKERKIQKYFVYYKIMNNNNIDNPSLKKKFKEISNLDLKLTLSNISNIRTKIITKYKNCTLDELIPKIGLELENFKYCILDILYDYKQKNT